MLYAMYDMMVRPSCPGHGFANSKRACAFSNMRLLKDFLEKRESYDFTACRISRVTAISMQDIFRDRI